MAYKLSYRVKLIDIDEFLETINEVDVPINCHQISKGIETAVWVLVFNSEEHKTLIKLLLGSLSKYNENDLHHKVLTSIGYQDSLRI